MGCRAYLPHGNRHELLAEVGLLHLRAQDLDAPLRQVVCVLGRVLRRPLHGQLLARGRRHRHLLVRRHLRGGEGAFQKLRWSH